MKYVNFQSQHHLPLNGDLFQPACAASPMKSSASSCNFCFWSRCWIRQLKTKANSRQLQNDFSFLIKLGEQRELLKCIQWSLWMRNRVTWLLCIRLIVEVLRSAIKTIKESLKVSQATQVIGLHSWNSVESTEKLPLLRRNLPFWSYSGFSASQKWIQQSFVALMAFINLPAWTPW